jgi:hypothetical protein
MEEVDGMDWGSHRYFLIGRRHWRR